MLFPSADQMIHPTKPSVPSTKWSPRPSAPTRNSFPCPLVLSANASRETSVDHPSVLNRPAEVSLRGFAPSVSEIHSSILFWPTILMYIRRFPSGEMVGCVAFSDTMSTDDLVRG